MTIVFDSIPVGIRTPGTWAEFSSERAVQGTPTVPHIALAIGQRLAAGSVAAGTPILVPSGDDADTYFGRGSYLANMCRAFKAINTTTELWAIAVDDAGGGTQATETITITGPSTAAGNLYIYVEGRRIVVTVPSGAVQNDIADLVYAAIAAETDLSVTVANPAANVITATARHKGTLGSQINFRQNLLSGETTCPGVSVVFAAGVAGATDPALSGAITAMADVQYHTVISGLADDTNLDLLEAELEERWGPMVAKEGIAFVGYVGTSGNATSYGNARNSKQTVVMAAGESSVPAWLWAAVTAAAEALETDPSRPRQTLALTPAVNRYFAPPPEDRFTQTERATVLTDGMSTHIVDAGGIVRIDRLITTYQTNPLSVVDTAYLSLETMRTLAYLRYSMVQRITLRFPRHKLADDGTRFAPGQPVVTPALIRAELLALFSEWESSGLVEGWEQFKDDLLVERDRTDTNRVNVRMSPDLINQFMVFAGQVQFIL